MPFTALQEECFSNPLAFSIPPTSSPVSGSDQVRLWLIFGGSWNVGHPAGSEPVRLCFGLSVSVLCWYSAAKDNDKRHVKHMAPSVTRCVVSLNCLGDVVLLGV